MDAARGALHRTTRWWSPTRPRTPAPTGAWRTSESSADARDAATGGDAPVGPWPEAPGLCNERWCCSNPLPQGNRLASMCGRSASDVWAAGDGGTLLHWDGTSWSRIATGTTADLADIWCAPGGEVWTVGQEKVLRLSGGVVSNLAPPPTAADTLYYWSVTGTPEGEI